MIDLDERPREAVLPTASGQPESSASKTENGVTPDFRGVSTSEPVVGPTPDMLFAEAKRRARRRHILVGGGVGAVVIGIVTVVALLLPAGFASPMPSVSERDGDVVPPRRSAPAFYVRDGSSATQAASDIQVVSTSTGRVIRTLKSEPSPGNGFDLSPDGKTLYYSPMDFESQTIHVVAIPIAGGRESVIADGIFPQVSPDGTKITYRPNGNSTAVNVLDLQDGTTKTTHFPKNWTDGPGRYIRVQVSWLPDSRSLYATTSESPSSVGIDCAYGATCQYPPGPYADSAAYRLAPGSATWEQLPAAPTPEYAEEAITLIGAGWQSGTVLGSHWSKPVEGDRGATVLDVIDASTGEIVSQTPAPAGTTIAGRDTSGANFLLNGESALSSWSPATGATSLLGPAAADAAW